MNRALLCLFKTLQLSSARKRGLRKKKAFSVRVKCLCFLKSAHTRMMWNRLCWASRCTIRLNDPIVVVSLYLKIKWSPYFPLRTAEQQCLWGAPGLEAIECYNPFAQAGEWDDMWLYPEVHIWYVSLSLQRDISVLPYIRHCWLIGDPFPLLFDAREFIKARWRSLLLPCADAAKYEATSDGILTCSSKSGRKTIHVN